MNQSLTFKFPNQDKLEAFASGFADNIRELKLTATEPLVVFMLGTLGAGKSTTTRKIISHLGHKGNIPSPTYAILESYNLGDLQIHHLDLYRLSDPAELEMLGFFDLLQAENLFFIEWPQLLSGVVEPSLTFNLEHVEDDPDARQLVLDFNQLEANTASELKTKLQTEFAEFLA